VVGFLAKIVGVNLSALRSSGLRSPLGVAGGVEMQDLVGGFMVIEW